MKNIRDSWLELFKNEEIRNNVREIIKPIATIIYNETYLYIWLLCTYSIFLLLIGLANIYFLFKILAYHNTNVSREPSGLFSKNI
jgi:hypothetical protein